MRTPRSTAALCLAAALSVASLAGPVENIAGTGVAGSTGDGGPALEAQLDNPFGIARGPDGALWFADYAAHVIRRIGSDGTISTIVGNGRAGFSGDGSDPLKASLNHPHEIRFDRNGHLFISDTSNHVIRRYDPASRRLTTVAGTASPGYAGDGGPATNALLKLPISIQFSPAGDLYIADIGNHVIRAIDSKTGIISTFAGTGVAGPTPDGSALRGTPLNGPRSLDFDRAGILWLVTREGNQLLRINPVAGEITIAAGTGNKGNSGDGGPGRRATLNGPKGVAVAPDGSVYLADAENNVIRRYDPRRLVIERIAGTGKRGDGPAQEALATDLSRPHGILVDSDGTVFIGDSYNHRIRKFTSEPVATKP